MTLIEMKYLLKRYSFIETGLRQGRNSILISRGGRTERIVLDESVKKFSCAVKKTLTKADDFARILLTESVIEGCSDIFIYTNNNITKNTFYYIKANFYDSLFHLCICMDLVTEEEL